MKLSDIGKNATEKQKLKQRIASQESMNILVDMSMQKISINTYTNIVQKFIEAIDRRTKLAKNHSLKSELKQLYLVQLIKKLISIIIDTIFYKVVFLFQDTRYIDKNLLRQNTYYKTLTSRP